MVKLQHCLRNSVENTAAVVVCGDTHHCLSTLYLVPERYTSDLVHGTRYHPSTLYYIDIYVFDTLVYVYAEEVYTCAPVPQLVYQSVLL